MESTLPLIRGLGLDTLLSRFFGRLDEPFGQLAHSGLSVFLLANFGDCNRVLRPSEFLFFNSGNL
jgi:hypothetical protein